MRLRLDHRDGMRVVEVAHRRVGADEDELAEGGTRAAALEQPEQALDRDVHGIVGSLLAGGQVQHMRHALEGALHGRTVLHRAVHRFDPLRCWQRALVTEGAHAPLREPGVPDHAVDEGAADLAGRAGDEDERRGECHRREPRRRGAIAGRAMVVRSLFGSTAETARTREIP
jgi:hypothetical protein